ncbi:unnamed protein product [Acanthoscelides obtectus]|nr:unnamed protein product [Acanthoscelides obtectus]CAK1685388.1 Retrovirus-related Pol polyprotein from transposon gypsy [Acanthoscelides obtectus]
MIVNLDNETDQPDCQELPTVDNTNTDKDIINETEQTDYHELPFVIDKTNTNEDELDKDDETRHSNNQHPVVTIPISDQPLNFGQNQIVIKTVLHSPAKPKIIILFERKQRLLVQISKNNLESDVVNFVKEYIVPDVPYYIYFEDPDIYEPFSGALQKYFKWPSIKFKRCLEKLLDITSNDEIKSLIQNYHEGKSNHRGIDETYSRLKQKYYWPNLKSSVQS